MTVQSESQAPENAQLSEAPARAHRASQPPSLKLVSPPLAPTAVALAGLRGEGPGYYYAGAGVLSPSARVGILCDTLHGDREIGLDYQAGLHTAAELITELAFEPVVDRTHAAVAPYFGRWAGSARERLEHFVRLLDDYRVDAVFPLFGKGGCHGVIDALTETSYRPKRPVALIGGFSHHSDWSLFAQSTRGRGFFSHVVNTTQCAYWKILPRANVDNLKTVLHGADSVEYRGLIALNQKSQVRSPIVSTLAGGNLGTMVLNKDKTWMPSLRDRIVLCEDYDRHAHDFHRTFSAFVRLAERTWAAAIVVGAMLPMKRAAPEPERRRQQTGEDREEIAAVVREVASRTELPVFSHAGLFGHGAMNYPLGFGGFARISAQNDGSFALFNQLKVRT